MGFDEFYGNARVREYLESAFKRGAVPAAFLISGERGSGKRTLAMLLAQALVCTGDMPPCGTCNACRKARAGVHPDITVFDSGDAKIKVDEIREMRASAYISPNDGERKVYIICSADNMTQEAQDALLKILEEPPQFTAFILLCYNHNSLLSTVRSRVTHLKLAPLTDEEMDARLREHCQTLTDAERALRIAMAEGFFGRAINPDAPSDAVLQATAISDALATGNELKILESMILLERLPRDDLRMVLDALKVILHNIVTTGTDARGALKTESVLRLCEVADVGRALLVCNVGSAHVCGMLACKFYEAITRGGQAFD